MKRSLVLGIVGLSVAAVTSYGQYILLDNYLSEGTILTYGGGVPANGVSGLLGTPGAALNEDWTVGLYWTAGTVSLTDPAGWGFPIAPLTLGTGTGSTTVVADSSVFGLVWCH